MHAVHDYVYSDVLRLWFSIAVFYIADMKISPQQPCARHRNSYEISAIDSAARTLCRGGFTFVFFIPFAKADIPQSE